MKTLELKHLAPYLPYGIPAKLSRKGIFNQDDEYPNPRVSELGIIKNISFWHPEITGQLHLSETYSFDFDEIDEVDIVLRPLSDLTNDEFTFVWEKEMDFDSIVILSELDSESFQTCKFSYEFWQSLFKNRFDVFGLIPKNLAIDINTINQ